jgi:transaldolase
MPPKIIDQISKFGKSFNELTIDTVKGFLSDSKKSKFSL